MKKLIIILVCLVIMGSIKAQEHLSFKGVPIDGTLKQYTAAMVKAGFKSEGTTSNGIALLIGDFAGYKGCYVIVSTLKDKDLVSTIGVVFPEQFTWGALEGSYLKLKEMLTTKYGKPDKDVKEFQNLTPSDDFYRLHALKMDCCNYQALFSTEKGDILLRLMHDDYLKCHVLLAYYDKINGLEVEAAAMDDL